VNNTGLFLIALPLFWILCVFIEDLLSSICFLFGIHLGLVEEGLFQG